MTEVAHDLLGGGSLAAVLEPLKVRNTAEQIADRLVTAIALGEFVPEQRLPPERELAATLGVSRASVREALHRLAATGYVVISRGPQRRRHRPGELGAGLGRAGPAHPRPELGRVRGAVRPAPPARGR